MANKSGSLYGVDISSYQAGYRPGSHVDFVIVKSTEGTTYTNPYHDIQATRARNAGAVVGHYHYLHPGNPVGQARYFVGRSSARPDEFLVCDWERTRNGDPSCADKDAFIREVKRLKPNLKVGLYCNTYYWTHLDNTSDCGDFLWIAQYSSREPTIQHPFLFWQYTSDPIDQNRGYFKSRQHLKAWASSSDLFDTDKEEKDWFDMATPKQIEDAFYNALVRFATEADIFPNPMGDDSVKSNPDWTLASHVKYDSAWTREIKEDVHQATKNK